MHYQKQQSEPSLGGVTQYLLEEEKETKKPADFGESESALGLPKESMQDIFTFHSDNKESIESLLNDFACIDEECLDQVDLMLFNMDTRPWCKNMCPLPQISKVVIESGFFDKPKAEHLICNRLKFNTKNAKQESKNAKTKSFTQVSQALPDEFKDYFVAMFNQDNAQLCTRMYDYYTGRDLQQRLGFNDFLQLFIYWKRRQIHFLQQDRDQFENKNRSTISD